MLSLFHIFLENKIDRAVLIYNLDDSYVHFVIEIQHLPHMILEQANLQHP